MNPPTPTASTTPSSELHMKEILFIMTIPFIKCLLLKEIFLVLLCLPHDCFSCPCKDCKSWSTSQHKNMGFNVSSSVFSTSFLNIEPDNITNPKRDLPHSEYPVQAFTCGFRVISKPQHLQSWLLSAFVTQSASNQSDSLFDWYPSTTKSRQDVEGLTAIAKLFLLSMDKNMLTRQCNGIIHKMASFFLYQTPFFTVCLFLWKNTWNFLFANQEAFFPQSHL